MSTEGNRLARDALVAADAVEAASLLGIRVFVVDGTRDAEATADDVEVHFRPYL